MKPNVNASEVKTFLYINVSLIFCYSFIQVEGFTFAVFSVTGGKGYVWLIDTGVATLAFSKQHLAPVRIGSLNARPPESSTAA